MKWVQYSFTHRDRGRADRAGRRGAAGAAGARCPPRGSWWYRVAQLIFS